MCCIINTLFLYLLICFNFVCSVDNSETASSQPGSSIDLKTTAEAYLKYTFEDGLKCSEVTYDGATVWKYTPRERQPVSVCFSIKGNTAFVNFKESVDIIKLESNGWKPVYSADEETIILDISKKTSTDFFHHSGSNNVHAFIAKDNYLFGRVKKSHRFLGSGKEIWNTEDSFEYADKVIYDKTDPKNKILIIHQVNGLKRTFKKENGQWKDSEVKDSGTTLSQDKVEFITDDALALPTKFEKDDNYLKYTIEDGTKCLGVKYDGKEVWKRDSSKAENPHPESIYFSIKGNTAFVNFKSYRNIIGFNGTRWKTFFSGISKPISINVLYRKSCDYYDCYKNNQVYTYLPKRNVFFNKVIRHFAGSNDPEELIFETTYAVQLVREVVYDETKSDKVVIIHQVNGLKRTFKKENGQWKESEVKDSGSILSKDKVEIITDDLESNGFKLEKSSIYLKYTFDDRNNCTAFEYDNQKVWERDAYDPNAPHPESVVFSVKGNRVLANYKESMKIFGLDNGVWKSLYSGNPTAVESDIGKKLSTDVFDYNVSGKVHTYTPKENHMFSTVVKKKMLGSNETIWSTGYFADYADKVIYDETDPNNLVVTIYHINGLIRTFEKPKNGNWQESEVKGCGSELSKDKVKFTIKHKDVVSPVASPPPAGSGQDAGGDDGNASALETSESKNVSSDSSGGSTQAEDNPVAPPSSSSSQGISSAETEADKTSVVDQTAI